MVLSNTAAVAVIAFTLLFSSSSLADEVDPQVIKAVESKIVFKAAAKARRWADQLILFAQRGNPDAEDMPGEHKLLVYDLFFERAKFLAMTNYLNLVDRGAQIIWIQSDSMESISGVLDVIGEMSRKVPGAPALAFVEARPGKRNPLRSLLAELLTISNGPAVVVIDTMGELEPTILPKERIHLNIIDARTTSACEATLAGN